MGKCIVCRKAAAEVFRACRKCVETYDSTTGDRLPKKKSVFYEFQSKRRR